MIEDFYNFQSQFNYIDSSEDQDYQYGFQKKGKKNIGKNKSSQCGSSSSQEDRQKYDKKPIQKFKNQYQSKGNKRKLCEIQADDFLINDNYLNQLQGIIKENQQKISKKTALLMPDTDHQLLQNMQKRKKNYGFFLKALQVDKNYNKKMSQKVNKLKQQNLKKKKVLQTKKASIAMKQDEGQMKKYILQKKNKQEIVVDKIQKHAYKLGLQRVRQEYKKIKHQVKQIEQKNNLKATNMQIKQKNQIEQLKQQLQKMKEMNRINKIDQVKALKDMQKNVQSNKNLLLTKAQLAQQRKFII